MTGPEPTLCAFFAAIGPYLRGRTELSAVAERLGPVDPELAFYAGLVRFDQRRILSGLYADCRAWVERSGVDWGALCDAYARAHPPAGWSVPGLGARFPDWIGSQREVDGRLPAGIEALADWTWTRLVARNAPDEPGLGLERRVHVRRYPLDPAATRRALREGRAVDEAQPCTWVVYRAGDRVRTIPATAATLAVLVAAAQPGLALPPPLGEIPLPDRETERLRLQELGVLPPPEVSP